MESFFYNSGPLTALARIVLVPAFGGGRVVATQKGERRALINKAPAFYLARFASKYCLGRPMCPPKAQEYEPEQKRDNHQTTTHGLTSAWLVPEVGAQTRVAQARPQVP